MSATASTPVLGSAEREQCRLLHRHGIEVTGSTTSMLATYVARTRRARWCGVVGVVVAAAVGLLGPSGDAAGLSLARLLLGYLLGTAAAELSSRDRDAGGAVHAASLTTRRPRLLVPVWARVVPWLVLLPCLAAPALLLGEHPRGVVRVHDARGSAMATAHWFSPGVLVAVAVSAGGALVVWRVTLRHLARRRLPVDDAGAARVDLLTRGLSARALSGAAVAVGLCLLGGLATLSADPLMSMTCRSATDCGYVYAWHAMYDLFQTAGLVALVAALLVFWLSRLGVVRRSLLRTAAEPAALP